MKVIARSSESNYSSERRWLVEVTEEDLNVIAGRKYGDRLEIKVGMEIKTTPVIQLTNKIINEKGAVAKAAGSLRAVADLLENIEPSVRELVSQPPQEMEVASE